MTHRAGDLALAVLCVPVVPQGQPDDGASMHGGAGFLHRLCQGIYPSLSGSPKIYKLVYTCKKKKNTET